MNITTDIINAIFACSGAALGCIIAEFLFIPYLKKKIHK